MTRVAVLDRQPAVRAGLDAMLRCAPGLTPVEPAEADVVVVDSVEAVRRSHGRVVLFAADVTPSLVLAAAVAGADAIVSKESDDLIRVIRAVASGERVFPPVAPREQSRLAALLDPRDRPIFAMRLAGVSPREIASVVGLGVSALNARIGAIVGQLGAAPLPV